MTLTEAEKLVNQIERNAKKRQELEANVAALRERGDALIVAADDAGVSKLALARAAQMTRQTIYTILLRAKAAA